MLYTLCNFVENAKSSIPKFHGRNNQKKNCLSIHQVNVNLYDIFDFIFNINIYLFFSINTSPKGHMCYMLDFSNIAKNINVSLLGNI